MSQSIFQHLDQEHPQWAMEMTANRKIHDYNLLLYYDQTTAERIWIPSLYKPREFWLPLIKNRPMKIYSLWYICLNSTKQHYSGQAIHRVWCAASQRFLTSAVWELFLWSLPMTSKSCAGIHACRCGCCANAIFTSRWWTHFTCIFNNAFFTRALAGMQIM